MTDIFVVAIVSTLVQLRGVATIRVGPAAVAFGAGRADDDGDPRVRSAPHWDPILVGGPMRDDPELSEAVVGALPPPPGAHLGDPDRRRVDRRMARGPGNPRRGPMITVSFHNAAGLVVGKTKIGYREVRSASARHRRQGRSHHGGDRRAEREAAPWMVEDTHFWVVRARVAAAEVSGLETLLSGRTSASTRDLEAPRRNFTGLERRRSSAGGPTAGRSSRARRARWGRVADYFRHLQVGQVTTSDSMPTVATSRSACSSARRSIASS